MPKRAAVAAIFAILIFVFQEFLPAPAGRASDASGTHLANPSSRLAMGSSKYLRYLPVARERWMGMMVPSQLS